MFSWWGKPTISSVDEQRFCDAWLKERAYTMTLAITILGLITHISAVALLPLFVHPNSIVWFTVIHSPLILSCGLALVFRKRSHRVMGLTAFLSSNYLIFGYDAALINVSVNIGSMPDIMWATFGVLAYVPFAVLLTPNYGPVSVLRNILLAAAGGYAMSYTPAGVVGSVIMIIFVSALVALRGYQDASALREAKREFMFRSRIAPAHVIRHALTSGAALDSVFRPEVKFCVCVSSDWRSYQELSAGMSSTQLSGALGNYYDLCQALLAKCLPDGNFYSDWIADEFFVVIFAADNQTGDQNSIEERLVQQAVAFATQLVRAKEAFCDQHGLPRAIDVGVAAGPALLGIMGPVAHRKVTALGETPGRSRRLQTAGKLLRNTCGAHDRVVFGADVLMKLRAPAYDVRHYRVDGGVKLRDVHDPDLYYIEPEAEPARLNQVA